MRKPLAIISLFARLLLTAQNEDIDLESFAERLFEVQDEAISYEDIYESLLVLHSNKLDLNKASYEELSSIYLLSPSQLNNFFNYRDQYSDLLSIHELQVIPGFDPEAIRLLIPFVTVKESLTDPRPFLTRVLKEENNYLLLRHTQRLETQLGFTEALPLDTTYVRDESNEIIDTLTTAPRRYRGSSNKLYGRFRTSHRDDFSIGFTFEKDQGEKFEFTTQQRGFDFYSYHLLLENKLGFKKVLIGDYQLQVGQGIVFGAGFNAGKGAETVNTVKRTSVGILPYTSVLEAGFFRGIGLTKELGNFEVTTFYSQLAQDGNIQVDTTFSDFDEFVSSIQNTGFHRTANELSIKDQIQESSFGGVIEYRPHRRLSIGMTGLSTQYSTPVQRRPNNYNQFEFKGGHNHVGSAYFHLTWQNFTFFGEAARSRSGGMGAISGFVSSLSPVVDMALAIRNYDRDFHSFYGNAFSENSRNINEQGIYWGLSITPNRKHKLNIYYDRFSFPWLKFGAEAPSTGNEWLARYQYKPGRSVVLYSQVRKQLRQVTLQEGNLNVLRDQLKTNYLFNIDYEPQQGLKLRTRVQTSTQTEGDVFTKGFAIVQDINFHVWKLKLNTRMALFETDDFDNAQYVYENDVLYAFTFNAYSGSGIRNYLMIRYDPMKTVSVWIRYARTTFPDAGKNSSIGSSLESSLGDTVSEIKVMTRMKF